ncbi:hypothetical protein BDV98DRAFT_595820 [Pterulicium gracile]|uniref:Uncharacterized protein n=1 Tax=Pterulicium gracile TaxID=1884261 RepID=A0A5C3QAU6_9AGAR|nr:hypothetical protein BDV98DRAFT_595820 [Pterula gracilis]
MNTDAEPASSTSSLPVQSKPAASTTCATEAVDAADTANHEDAGLGRDVQEEKVHRGLDHPTEDGGLAKLLTGLATEECYELFEVFDTGVQKLDSLPEKPIRSSHKRYEKKYPQDEEGKGMNPDARVWRVYLDESGQFDLDMVEGIKDTVDVMLVSSP